MKYNLIGLLGAVLSFVFLVLSEIRYFVLFPDMDKAIAYSVIGLLGIFCSWAYAVIKHNEDRLYAIEEHLEDMHK